MAERTFKSPGVSTLEIDRSSPSASGPQGVPAGIVGTAQMGPAFVPVTVKDLATFENKFGLISGNEFGPIAAQEWLKNARALTYTRVLGSGNGQKRSTSDGTVTSAGFVAGARLPLDSGLLGDNAHANTGGAGLGRSYLLGCFMSASAGSTIFADAGISSVAVGTGGTGAHPMLRAVLLTPSGVALTLSSSNRLADNTPSATDISSAVVGSTTGSVNFANGSPLFSMLMVGHKGSSNANVLTASFNPTDANYFGNIFNKDPELIEEHGHLLYTHYDINPEYAVVTGSGVTIAGPDLVNGEAPLYVGSSDVAFLLNGSQNRNAGTATAPNFENFEDRFKAAKSPFVISQKFGGSAKDLFRVHMLSDGVAKGKASDSAGSNTKFKISIESVGKSADPLNKYGTFDLIVRDFYDNDENPYVYEAHRGLSLDPTSVNYIARRIGDQSLHFDFDKALGSQKLVIEGKYANLSSRIRVEMTTDVDDAVVDSETLPLGFRGLDHLVTSGSNAVETFSDASQQVNPNIALKWVTQLPVPMRENLAVGVSPKKIPNKALYWGVQFEKKQLLAQPNKSNSPEPTVLNLTKYFPDFAVSIMNVVTGSNAGQSDENGYVLDCDRFNNNVFTMENVQVGTGSTGAAIVDDTTLALSWSYVRGGNISANEAAKTRAFQVSDTSVPAVKRLVKFTMPLQGGFDGVNIFDKNMSGLTNLAVKGEMDDSNRGLTSGPTIAAYRKALDILGEKADVDIQLLAVPGIRHAAVTDSAISTVENRFDALYVMDVEERDTVNAVVTSSIQQVNVGNTVTAFSDRALDTSFAAAYFPDLNQDVAVKTFNSQTKTTSAAISTVRVPPSVGVLGALAFNDSVAFPWFAPAGFARGSLTANSTAVSLNAANLDDLNDKNINPILSFPGSAGPVIFGQQTLQTAASALDRVNVRRLLIDVRRSVKQVAQLLIFEPNRESTLQRFTALVTPILQRVQQNQGLDRFKVLIDSSTTTQVDIENNTVRGKIFLQPTRTAEFISLDFVVSNSGVDGL